MLNSASDAYMAFNASLIFSKSHANPKVVLPGGFSRVATSNRQISTYARQSHVALVAIKVPLTEKAHSYAHIAL